jgi:hypothetical protein
MQQGAAEPMAEVITYISSALNLLQVCLHLLGSNGRLLAPSDFPALLSRRPTVYLLPWSALSIHEEPTADLERLLLHCMAVHRHLRRHLSVAHHPKMLSVSLSTCSCR